jgi:hypothetical protein
MKRRLSIGLALACMVGGPLARAEQPEPSAEDLFKQAKTLRDGGHLEEACDRFSDSYRLQPAVGAGLYLGDCYQRLGRTASALSAFRDVERMAGERGDKRAAVARKRADALELHLGRLIIAVDPTIKDPTIALDGITLGNGSIYTPIPADPGDHVITLDVPGRPQFVAHAHVDPDGEAPVVHLELPPAPPHPEPPALESATPPPKKAAVPPPARAERTPTPQPASETVVSRRWFTVGLLGVGAAGIGTGAALLALKNQSMTTGAPSGAPVVDERLTATSIMAFSAGGAALVAAVVVYLTTPHSSASAANLVIGPTMLPGGGGGVLTGRF